MLSDALALGLALFAAWLAHRPATPERSFGWRRAEVLAALANALVLVVLGAWIVWEGVGRLSDPPGRHGRLGARGRRRRPARQPRRGARAPRRGLRPQRPRGEAARARRSRLVGGRRRRGARRARDRLGLRRPDRGDPDRRARRRQHRRRAARDRRRAARGRARGDGRARGRCGDRRDGRRRRRPRPPPLDDHLRLPGPVGARPRRGRRRLPRDPARAGGAPARPLRADAHDTPGRARAGSDQAAEPVDSAETRPSRRPHLEGKTAIVTGASSGIGAAVVRDLRAEGVRVAGGARRVERIDADVALELDVTDVESCERFVAVGGGRARWGRHPLQQRRPGARPRPGRRVDRGGRGDRDRDQRRRADADHAPLPASHPGRRPHRQHGVDRRAAGLPERLLVHRVEVRGAGLHVRAPRGPARPADPRHDGGCGPRRDRVLGRSLSRRRGGGQVRLRRARAGHARRGRRLRHVRVDASAAREHRRDRGEGARAVERRAHRAEAECWRADDPRGIDVLHLRRDRRPRRPDERALRRGHALSLAARAAHRRRPPAPALVGEGRVLLRRLLPAQSGRSRAASGHALDRARALRRRGHAGSPDPPQRELRAALVRAPARGRHRLRGHHHRQGARLRARPSRDGAAAAAAGGRSLRRGREPARARGGDERRREDAGALLAAGQDRGPTRAVPARARAARAAGSCASTSSRRSPAPRFTRSRSSVTSERSATTCGGRSRRGS